MGAPGRYNMMVGQQKLRLLDRVYYLLDFFLVVYIQMNVPSEFYVYILCDHCAVLYALSTLRLRYLVYFVNCLYHHVDSAETNKAGYSSI
jgi:hypothetical protein